MSVQYPTALHLETATGCPATCSFCPHAGMGRDPKGLMPEALFRGVIDEAAAWPVQPARVLPFLTNEPLQDPRLPDLMRYVNERLPQASLTIFTNGALWTERLLARMEGVRNWADCFLSLHHSDPLRYQSEIGLNHAKVLQSIRRFLAWNERTRTVREVFLLRVTDGNAALDEAFRAFCAEEFPVVPVVVSHRWNWVDAGSLAVEGTLDHVCGRLHTAHIRQDGKMTRCCLDENAEHGFGAVGKGASVLDLYNAALPTALRAHTKRENGGVCGRCNMVG